MSIRTTVFSVLTVFMFAIPEQIIAQLEMSISVTRQLDDNAFGTYQ